MALIAWNESFSVNISDIDKQHKMLIKMVNDLYQAINASKDKEFMTTLLDRLFIYAQMHFAKEEHYFDVSQYPERKKHKKEHLDFEKTVSDFEKDYLNGRQDLTDEIISFLGKWLVDHIYGSDKKYSKFLTARGVK